MVVTADNVQMDRQALSRVEELFQDQIQINMHPGAALAVYRHGKLVIDLYGGVANTESGMPVSEDTLFLLYSATKPMAAACLYILWERGKLGWDDPIANHWPEFAQNGKAAITIQQILTHQSGFPETPKEMTWDKWGDWDSVVSSMEAITPLYKPGTVIAYHGINFGWVIAELVQRIDGRPFSQFMQEDMTRLLGMKDTYVGLPPSLESRVSCVYPMESVPEPRLALISDLNRPEAHQAVLPAVGGVAAARDLARFYAMMASGGVLEGAQILQPETVTAVTCQQVEGMDQTTGRYVYRSLGMELGDERMGMSGEAGIHTFGHGGAGTSVGWADSDLGLAVAYITNGYRGNETNNQRLSAISQAVRAACR